MTNEEAITTISYLRSEYNCFDEGRRRYHALSMAIEALENNDKLAEDLQNCLDMYKKKKAEVEALKQTQWIPCEERLPQTNVSLIYCTETGCVGEGRYEGYNGIHRIWKMYAVCGTHWDDEVLAWMPLPEPWKGEQNDNLHDDNTRQV